MRCHALCTKPNAWPSRSSRSTAASRAAASNGAHAPLPVHANREISNMGIIIWLIVGGIVGWLASIIMRRNAQQGIVLNVVVGIVGALIAGFLFGSGINQVITLWTFVWSLVGAVILLAIVNLFTRGRLR
ncbi:transglycosylase associated protein [Xanthomonas oryzae pv. oryzae KACC 10331]|uniref:Transglycosylase associated protein n=3 Tax=Xanthomonas oryzae pv. oryzae TaxID=64187 RepID=Q5GU17_XANOR|nr:transglycosylase associated protein [Xanthomonas oryzae pv. oryzae KACC 10331]